MNFREVYEARTNIPHVRYVVGEVLAVRDTYRLHTGELCTVFERALQKSFRPAEFAAAMHTFGTFRVLRDHHVTVSFQQQFQDPHAHDTFDGLVGRTMRSDRYGIPQGPNLVARIERHDAEDQALAHLRQSGLTNSFLRQFRSLLPQQGSATVQK